ncbi:MAG: malto-oligosyltrehalose synthase [Thermodesulfobacteriota bacterium]
MPTATYRIQFSPSFGFQEALGLVAYLNTLGISDLYASPIFRAKRGSRHGYDIVDPTELNPDLGTTDDFESLSRELKKNKMGWLQDIVPNHMAFDSENCLLMDVLENGAHSKYFSFFDVDWDYAYESIKDRILAPFLGRFYGDSLENGEIKLGYNETGLTVHYYNLILPCRLESYYGFFSHNLNSLRQDLGSDHPDYIKYLGILYILKILAADEPMVNRDDQVKSIKRMLWDLYQRNDGVKKFLNDNILLYNGSRESPESYNLLDLFLATQLFRLSFWKIATREINYRRFFNINQLISVKVEEEVVFNHTHELIFSLLRRGLISGLRVDHIDGLMDPINYLGRIKRFAPDSYLIVEKILGLSETLPRIMPVQGTTGYDFLNYLNGLFCQRARRKSLSNLYSSFIGLKMDFQKLVQEKKKLIIWEHMSGDVTNLAQMIKTVSSRYRHGLDLTLDGLRRALTEVLACFPVYRTYVNEDRVSGVDRKHILKAVSLAGEINPALTHELQFLRRFLLLEFPPYFNKDQRGEWRQCVMRFQQVTGPLMAKGYEDTALYIYNRLISLNEVGGEPDRCGVSLAGFHQFCRKRQKSWPHSLNATSTHDTKRGEDVRARINVLSEIPSEWAAHLKKWQRLNSHKKKKLRGRYIPDNNDEYFLYQTLIGALPFDHYDHAAFIDRIKQYAIKAVREAKEHTAWIRPDHDYEAGYINFIEEILKPDNAFWKEFTSFQKRIAHYGLLNSLSQALIKMTAPGVPDFYQGTEFWDFNLVDPDNRRTVAFESRKACLEEISKKMEIDRPLFLEELLATPHEPGIKLFLIYQTLQIRRRYNQLFQKGEYLPLKVPGALGGHIVAFTRRLGQDWAIIVAPRFLTSLVGTDEMPLGPEIWGDTAIPLPLDAPSTWKNVMTNQVKTFDRKLMVHAVLELFPVALLLPVARTPRSRRLPTY